MRSIFLVALLCAAPLLAGLPKPTHVAVSTAGPVPVVSWDGVDGAAVYRVAIFSAPDLSGKRALMAAVWIDGLSWPYGNSKVVPQAGKLRSTAAKALQAGMNYKAMVYAADLHGADRSDWVSVFFNLAGGAAPVSSGASSPLSPTPAVQADAAAASGSAELDMNLASEFKETPEAGAPALTTPASTVPVTLESARALLQAGQASQAEAVYQQLIDTDATNADYWEGLGDSYDAQMMKIEAKEAYQKALSIDGKRQRLIQWMQDNVKQ